MCPPASRDHWFGLQPELTSLALGARSARQQTLTKCTPTPTWLHVARVAQRGVHCHRRPPSTIAHCGPRPTRARGALRERAVWSAHLGCVRVGDGDRLRGRTACGLNASMRDHGCFSPGVPLCAVRARSALRAYRRGERSIRAALKWRAPLTLNAGTPARLTTIVTMATKHEGRPMSSKPPNDGHQRPGYSGAKRRC